MQAPKIILSAGLTFFAMLVMAQTKNVGHFSKIIVSPYIQVTLVQGEQESVTVDELHVDSNKLHIEVNNGTLRVYLEGAKDFPKNEKDYSNGQKETHPLYRNTLVVTTITYRELNELSLRGEEKQVCKSPLKGDRFVLKIYGESDVSFEKMDLAKLEATLYGEGRLNILAGSIVEQKYVCYGEGKINSLAVNGNKSVLTAYGEAGFKLNVSDRINITAFGDARLAYKGNPEIKKGLHVGNMKVDRID